MVLYCYILAPRTPKSSCSSGAKSIFLTPLLQCISINRCALFMKAKKKKIILFYQLIKIFFHSLSHFVPLSLSVTPSKALTLSQNSLKLSSSLSHSPLSPSLSQAPSFTTAGLTQPSQAADHLSVSPMVVVVTWVDRRRWVAGFVGIGGL